MSLKSRLKAIFGSKVNQALEQLEDPKSSLALTRPGLPNGWMVAEKAISGERRADW